MTWGGVWHKKEEDSDTGDPSQSNAIQCAANWEREKWEEETARAREQDTISRCRRKRWDKQDLKQASLQVSSFGLML